MSIFNNQISPRRLAKWQHKERMAMYQNPNYFPQNNDQQAVNFPYFPEKNQMMGTNFPYFPEKGTNFPYFPKNNKMMGTNFPLNLSEGIGIQGNLLDLLKDYNNKRSPTLYNVGGGVGPVNWNQLNEDLQNRSISSVSSRYEEPKQNSYSGNFSEAFKAARMNKDKTFTWKGKSYSTNLKSDTRNPVNNNAEMAEIATQRMNQFAQQNTPTYVGEYKGKPTTVKAKRLQSPSLIPSYNQGIGNQLANTRGDQTNLNDFQRMENSYNAGKTFLDLQGKEKQLAPLVALDAVLTYGARNIGLPIAKTVSGVGSTSDKVQSAMSLIPFASGVNSAIKPIAKQIAKQAIKKSTAYMGPRMLSPIAKNPNASKAKLAAWFTQANPQLAQAIKKYGVDYLINGL